VSERQAPLYCPYCGEEDLRPASPEAGDWWCAGCAHSFGLKFAGITLSGPSIPDLDAGLPPGGREGPAAC
jgi:hypothetical protein